MTKTARKTETAEQAYNRRAAQVRAQLTYLADLVDRHQIRFNGTDRRNWGFAGDLGYVEEQIREISAFLAGHPVQAAAK